MKRVSGKSFSRPAKQTQFGRPSGNGRAKELPGFEPLEARLCIAILVACAALHFPVIYHPLGLAIHIALSLFSFTTPVSGMLYLSASQVIPDPPVVPLSSSQIAICGFLIRCLYARSPALLDSSYLLLRVIAPFFLWNVVMTMCHGQGLTPTLLLTYSILTACVAVILVRQSGNRLGTCLIAFLAGQMLAAVVFWIVKLGLGEPVQAFNVEMYGDSTSGGRIGTARGNAGMLGMPMALCVIGAVAVWLSWPVQRRRQKVMLGALVMIWLGAVVPPLIGSGARGAIVSLLACLILFFMGGVMMQKALSRWPLMVVGVAVILCLGWQRLGLREHWEEMSQRQKGQQSETGTLVGGRELEWKAAWKGVLDSPIFGGGQVEILSFSGIEERWRPHSTYLDAGLTGGFPAMAMFIWLVLKPLPALWKRREVAAVACLLVVYIGSLIQNSYTSAMQIKQFWMLWGMAFCFFPLSHGLKPAGIMRRAKWREGDKVQKPEGRCQKSEARGQWLVVSSQCFSISAFESPRCPDWRA
jgi:O-antigen ligase